MAVYVKGRCVHQGSSAAGPREGPRFTFFVTNGRVSCLHYCEVAYPTSNYCKGLAIDQASTA